MFAAPKVHKQGKVTKKTSKGAFVGKVIDELKQGSRDKKDKKNPNIISEKMFEERLDESVKRKGVHLENKR